MSVLTRYVGREFLKLFFFCLIGLILVYLLFDFIDRAGNFFKSDPQLIHVLLYFFYKIPTIVFQLVPVSVLLSTLLTLAILSRNSEITAMKAGGVSVPRIVTPLVLMALLLSVCAFGINEFVVPVATQKMKYVKKVHIKNQIWREKVHKVNLWYKSPGAIYSIYRYEPELARMEDVQIYRFNDDFTFTERIDAATVQYVNDGWTAYDGIQRSFADNRLSGEEPFTELRLKLPETPADLKIVRPDPDQMGVRDLWAYIGKLRHEGYDVRKYVVDLHGKISFSLISVVMAVLGIPWAIRSGRQGGVAFGIGLAVIIGVIYWIVLGLSLALGRSGALPPVAAAWGPHVVFGIAGLFGVFRVRS